MKKINKQNVRANNKEVRVNPGECESRVSRLREERYRHKDLLTSKEVVKSQNGENA